MGQSSKNKSPLMERAGLWYMKKLHNKRPPKRIDVQTYVLDQEERAAINRIERQAIINVVIAGAVSSVFAGLASFFADPLSIDGDSLFSENSITYWGIVLGVTIVASLIELVYIYYDIMAKAHDLSKAAHMDLFPKDNDESLVAAPIVRAALELPNKKNKELNIDPRRESSKALIILATLVYRMKVSVTNFLLKSLVKRMLGRALSRAWLSFLSIPVCAFWNGMVCWIAMREIKIRVIGPSAVNELLNTIKPVVAKMPDNARIAIFRAIGSSIVRTADLHPNLEYMFRSFTTHIGKPTDAVLDNSKLFLEELKTLGKSDQEIVLKTLVFASIIDGKINYREKKLLESAYQVCGIVYDHARIRSLLKRFKAGQLLEFALHLK
jgi:hypothetical protein